MLKPSKLLKIEKSQIFAKTTCVIIIDEKQYDTEKTLIETSTHFIVPGIITVYSHELEDHTSFMVNYPVKIIKPDNIGRDKKVIYLNYKPGDIMIEQNYYTDETNIDLFIKLMEGRLRFIKNPKQLLLLSYDQIPSIDLVHLEVVISNMFRCKDDTTVKCRHVGYKGENVIIGQTNQPFIDSWYSAMAFQYIDKGIKSGLIKGKDAVMNPLEKIMVEDYDSL